MTTVTVFDWTVILQNDRMGFTKTFRVQAPYVQGAIDVAFDQLAASGYDDQDFNTISAVRGTNVRTVDMAAQARDFSEAHAEGMHDEIPREGCPECDDKKGRTGP